MTTERRARPRRAPSRPYSARVYSERGLLVGMGLPENVSEEGVCLLVAHPYSVGEVLTLVPESPHPIAGRQLTFQVTRCQAASGGGHYLAGSFTRQLGNAEVLALGS